MKSYLRFGFLLFFTAFISLAFSQGRRPVYNPCILKDSLDKHLEFIKLNASRIFIDTFECRQSLFDSMASRYLRSGDKKYLDVLSYIHSSSAAQKVEGLYTEVLRKLIQTDFLGFLNHLYTGKGKYLPLEKELIATMNMIVDGRPYKQKYMGLLNVEISKAQDKKDTPRSYYLEKLKTNIEEENY
jgi:hypothetical protein